MFKKLFNHRTALMVMAAAVISLSLFLAGCAGPDAGAGRPDGEELPWNSPANWERQAPIGTPY